MRRIRIFALGIVSFFAVLMGALLAPGTFVNRALSAALCTVFSFNSTICTVNLVNSSDRVVAATPLAMERNIADWLVQRAPGEFDDAPSVRPGSNPQAPPFPQDPGPNQPLRPDFDNDRQPSDQRNPDNIKQSGSSLWFYRAYISSNANEDDLLFAAVFDIQQSEAGESQVNVCKDSCLNAIGNLNLQDEDFQVEDTAWIAQGADLKTTTVSGKNHKLYWGELESSTASEKIFFSIVNLNYDTNFQSAISIENLQKSPSMAGRMPTPQKSLSLEMPIDYASIRASNVSFTGEELTKLTDVDRFEWSGKQTQTPNELKNIAKNKPPGQYKAALDTALKALKEKSSQGYRFVEKNLPKLGKLISSPQTARALGNIVSGISRNGKAIIPFLRGAGSVGLRLIPVVGQVVTLASLAYGVYEAIQFYNSIPKDELGYRNWCREHPNWCGIFSLMEGYRDVFSQAFQGVGEIATDIIGSATKNLVQGSSWGDPHLTSFDGQKYDHHAIGEFVLTRSKDKRFEVQVREAPYGSSSSLGINIAAAMRVGNDRVAIYSQDFPDNNTQDPLRVNGKTISGEKQNLSGGGFVARTGSGSYLVQWPSGEQVTVKIFNKLVEVTPGVSEGDRGQLEGLLGNFNGNPSDDFMTRDGRVIAENKEAMNIARSVLSNFNVSRWIPIPIDPLTEAFLDSIHRQFGDSWRISQTESLFDYPAGKNTDSFTNKSFPNGFKILRMLAPQAVQLAEETCRKAEVPNERLEGCLFDVAASGDVSLASVAANILKNEVKQRVEQEIRNRIPIPIPLPF